MTAALRRFVLPQNPPTWSDVRGAPSSESASKRRRKSFGADSPEVVTIGVPVFNRSMRTSSNAYALDQIRPDWEAKLAAVRAAVARRANRRIIMRQVGDRLIPVGISSGRVHALPAEDMPEGAEGGGERGSRRSRRRGQNNELNQYLGGVGLAGQDLEEVRHLILRSSFQSNITYTRFSSLWSWKQCVCRFWNTRSSNGNSAKKRKRKRKKRRAVLRRRAIMRALRLRQRQHPVCQLLTRHRTRNPRPAHQRTLLLLFSRQTPQPALRPVITSDTGPHPPSPETLRNSPRTRQRAGAGSALPRP